ncbi:MULTISPECIES: hypothetical protein [Haloarcula]|uniref:hypothetical protein n=1 Tax=Haloarcula TaxID=2237 RepID=UPI0023E7B8FD|nr:hypothetical protein [Halomicroarcula sp. SHR3]
MKIPTDITTRQALLSVLLATLIVTSGCTGLLSGEGNTKETETETGTSTPEPVQADAEEKRTNGTDLRNMSVPENGSVSTAGELDHGDPSDGNKYYEPVQVAAVQGQTVNVTVEAESGNPAIRVVNPDGNTTEVVSNETGNKTGLFRAYITQTGGYTFEVTSVDQNATFNYTINIERVKIEDEEGLLEGDARTWNETEQYLFAAQSYGIVVNQYTDKGDVPYNVTKGNIAANAAENYAIITYEIPADYNFTQRNELDVAFQLSYEALLNQSQQGDNSVTDESWLPEIIFFRGVDNETGELVRTTFFTKEWAAQALADEISGTESSGNYYSTEKWGPASSLYDVSGYETVTADEFPQTYWNYTDRLPGNTTLAERYGLS